MNNKQLLKLKAVYSLRDLTVEPSLQKREALVLERKKLWLNLYFRSSIIILMNKEAAFDIPEGHKRVRFYSVNGPVVSSLLTFHYKNMHNKIEMYPGAKPLVSRILRILRNTGKMYFMESWAPFDPTNEKFKIAVGKLCLYIYLINKV